MEAEVKLIEDVHEGSTQKDGLFPFSAVFGVQPEQVQLIFEVLRQILLGCRRDGSNEIPEQVSLLSAFLHAYRHPWVSYW